VEAATGLFLRQNGMKKKEIAKNIKDIITELNSIELEMSDISLPVILSP
jgi:hypothetical protein